MLTKDDHTRIHELAEVDAFVKPRTVHEDCEVTRCSSHRPTLIIGREQHIYQDIDHKMFGTYLGAFHRYDTTNITFTYRPCLSAANGKDETFNQCTQRWFCECSGCYFIVEGFVDVKRTSRETLVRCFCKPVLTSHGY